jgi:hypothetical protein
LPLRQFRERSNSGGAERGGWRAEVGIPWVGSSGAWWTRAGVQVRTAAGPRRGRLGYPSTRLEA